MIEGQLEAFQRETLPLSIKKTGSYFEPLNYPEKIRRAETAVEKRLFYRLGPDPRWLPAPSLF